jgi:hypothetical protein
MSFQKPSNIVFEVDNIIDQDLNVTNIGQKTPHYKNITSCKRLRTRPLGFNAFSTISKIYTQLTHNLNHKDNHFHSGKLSKKNWRFEKQLEIDKDNKSKETTLEKAIARVSSSEWVNQVPTASGLIKPHADKKRNIDLVHRIAHECYEFIELKVDSDTPLYASFEILINGLIYLLSREFYQKHYKDAKDSNELLNGKIIKLQTLAPVIYYQGCSLSWLEEGLNEGLKTFLSDKFSNEIEMSFSFTSFPESFDWPCEEKNLLNGFHNRIPVKWNN